MIARDVTTRAIDRGATRRQKGSDLWRDHRELRRAALAEAKARLAPIVGELLHLPQQRSNDRAVIGRKDGRLRIWPSQTAAAHEIGSTPGAVSLTVSRRGRLRGWLLYHVGDRIQGGTP